MGRTRQVTSEKRRANKALRAGDGGKAAGSGADTRQAAGGGKAADTAPGEEHGRQATSGRALGADTGGDKRKAADGEKSGRRHGQNTAGC